MQYYQVGDKPIVVPEESVVAMTQEQVKRNAFGLRYLDPDQVDEVLGKNKDKLAKGYSIMEVIKSPGKVHFLPGEVFGVAATLNKADGLTAVANPQDAVDAAQIKELEEKLAALKGKK